MKKVLMVLLAALLLVGCNATSSEPTTATSETAGETTSTEPVKIGIVQLVEHPSLDQIREATLAQLKTLGYVDGETCTITYLNAQGDVANVTTIMQTLAGDKQDVVIAITTPVAQGAMSLTADTPVVFAAVTDPVGAGVVKALDDTSGNMTGTSDAVAVDQIMDLALTIQPDLKTVGYIYNAGEDNSVSNLEKLQAYCDSKGITVETSTISTSADLQTASSVMCQKVDAIFVANDNTVAEAMPVLANEAIKAGVPVYTGADSMVNDGGFATIGIDYDDLGIETANMADQILKGTAVSEIPVKVFDTDLYIYVNKKTAAALNIELPESITSNEKYVELGE